MVIDCCPFSLALSCSCSSFMSGMEFVMISFYSPSSRVSSPLCCAVTSCFSVHLSLLHLILFSPVSFDDAPHGNDEQSSYMRCQLHTQTYTDIREFISSPTPSRYRCGHWAKWSGSSFIGIAIGDHERRATIHFDHGVCGKM
jgi:hypothetical protein